MSVPATPKRPGRGWYAVATVMAVVATAILVLLGVWIGRAVAGYSVTPFDDGSSTTVTIGDRGVAIWVSPQDTPISCLARDVDTGESTLDAGSASKVTITDGGLSWSRVGIVKGEPGSKHLVQCEATGGEVLGYADNPRIGRYVLFGVVGGVLALVTGIAAFVIVLVVAIKRNRKPRPA
ncbi:hypothetical protein ASE12_07330 [Aeromicrobium sp. Root236]|uniref:hypothetical protein n=1 Tax=Aeromicrobium sp. Root236 TaxID=1736498 RepID=UPI0006F5E835|nr:hypothetical protein [Aeromicrobium sp. Root236]KRC64592.1 hypothetical protein ASE12_07330 [Aeromicrobium sp. Root236]